MAMKRRAEDELTPDNWQSAADKAAPDGGVAERASEEELAKRTFVKAKRRLAGNTTSDTNTADSESSSTSGLFAGFKGFSSKSALPGATGESKTFGSSTSAPLSSLGMTSASLASLAPAKPASSVAHAAAPVSSQSASLSTKNALTQDEYEARLSALNTSFVNWIQKHHEQDPLADFTPTFDDYKKHLAKLDAQLQTKAAAAGTAKPAFTVASVAPASSISSSSGGGRSIGGVGLGLTRSTDSAAAATNGGSIVVGSSSSISLSTSKSDTPSKLVTFAPIKADSDTTASSSTSSSTATGGLFAFTAGGSSLSSAVSVPPSSSTSSASSSTASPSSSTIGSGLKLASSGITFPTSILKSSANTSSASSSLMNLPPATSVTSGFFSGLVSSSSSSASASGSSSTIGSGIGSGLLSGSLGGGASSIPSFLLTGKKADNEVVAAGGCGGDDDENPDIEKDDMKPQEFDQDADVLYSTRAKLFYKKEDGFSELGLGMFKIINMDGKTQLLMRNFTRLGTILLNVMLGASTPVTLNKNNIMLVTMPNPPLNIKNSDNATATYLIRVKTAQDAGTLHQKITERKE
eukprot:scpid49139/ scgid34603/ Nuclear pore complex protein Nup50; 50 kDa nucleoporin; Nuclear pore-associated protein 60 kDa-like; Nucleoporin Nup50